VSNNLADLISTGTVIFLIGILGIFLNKKNIIIMLMSIEIILLAVNLNLVVFSVYLDDLIGQLFTLLILTVAASESAIGLAILVAYYRIKGSIAVQIISLLKN
jgi:NADH-quinone oxidoreductase subunit K